MSPTDTLTLRVEERGAKLTASRVSDVGDEVRQVGKRSRKSSKDVSIFSRAIQFMGIRAIIATGAVVALSVATLALAPQIAAITAAMFAFAAIAAPVALLAAGAMMIYKDTVEQAGSSASQLRDMLALLKHAFRVMVAPAAAKVFQGLSAAMEALLPTLESLRPAMTAFGAAIGAALVVAAGGLADNGPALATFIGSLGPLFMQAARMIGPLTAAFLAVAQIGLPMLSTLLGLLNDLLLWFTAAIPQVMSFNAVGDYLGGVLSSVGGIVSQLWTLIQPLLPFLGVALVGALNGLAAALDWVNRNFTLVSAILGPLLAMWAAYKIAMLASAAATAVNAAITAVLNALFYVSPLGWIALLVIALAAAFYILYTRSKTFRDILKSVWEWLKNAGDAIKTGFGAAIDWLVPKIEWLIDKLKWIFNHSPQGLAAKGVFGLGKKVLGAFAEGGPVTRSGSYMVGERGPEVVHLPAGAAVSPNGAGGDTWVVATLVMPDGTILAKQVVKAARKGQSTR